MSTNIYLVRHAHSIYTPDEIGRPLSPKGIKDAGKAKEILLGMDITVIISSPYARAIQTVQGLYDELGCVFEIWDELRERKISKEPVKDFNAAMDMLWGDYNFSFEGGESNQVAQLRGIKGINKVLDKFEGENIVIGTHGNIMVLIMNYFDNNYDYSFWKQLKMPDIYKLSFKSGKIKEIAHVK
ncbi:phosphoglycerate mutase [Kosmotoga arenicorallina S304]|uniref:Phosphoglycerate mutase n=1 Tax=Kosmotoga arenicorallina S304 TaxID=1453497 RepID=A0A176K0M8_9BACT|nr:phosphoglycerate mutase [Kosmotoga arenicorallina S304]